MEECCRFNDRRPDALTLLGAIVRPERQRVTGRSTLSPKTHDPANFIQADANDQPDWLARAQSRQRCRDDDLIMSPAGVRGFDE